MFFQFFGFSPSAGSRSLFEGCFGSCWTDVHENFCVFRTDVRGHSCAFHIGVRVNFRTFQTDVSMHVCKLTAVASVDFQQFLAGLPKRTLSFGSALFWPIPVLDNFSLFWPINLFANSSFGQLLFGVLWLLCEVSTVPKPGFTRQRESPNVHI